MSNGLFNQPSDPSPAQGKGDMPALAKELETLVDRMEDEVRTTGTISGEAAQRLKELRHKLSQVFGSSGS